MMVCNSCLPQTTFCGRGVLYVLSVLRYFLLSRAFFSADFIAVSFGGSPHVPVECFNVIIEVGDLDKKLHCLSRPRHVVLEHDLLVMGVSLHLLYTRYTSFTICIVVPNIALTGNR